jgi:hexosaminidase
VHLDACDGKLVATLPLDAAVGHAGVSPLRAELENMTGVHDLCLKVVRPEVNPLWSLDWVQLEPLQEKR